MNCIMPDGLRTLIRAGFCHDIQPTSYGIDSGYVEVALRRLLVRGYILYSNPRGDEHPVTSPVGEAAGDLKTNLPVQHLSIMLLNAYSAPALGQVTAGKRGAATSIAPETESRLPVPLNIKWSDSVRFLTIVELVIRSHIQYLDDR